jgi:hypothetical protein
MRAMKAGAKAPARAMKGSAGGFKPCKGCPNPSKCKAMGMCMKKAK